MSGAFVFEMPERQWGCLASSWKYTCVFQKVIEGSRSWDSTTHGVTTEAILRVNVENEKRAEKGAW